MGKNKFKKYSVIKTKFSWPLGSEKKRASGSKPIKMAHPAVVISKGKEKETTKVLPLTSKNRVKGSKKSNVILVQGTGKKNPTTYATPWYELRSNKALEDSPWTIGNATLSPKKKEIKKTIKKIKKSGNGKIEVRDLAKLDIQNKGSK